MSLFEETGEGKLTPSITDIADAVRTNVDILYNIDSNRIAVDLTFCEEECNLQCNEMLLSSHYVSEYQSAMLENQRCTSSVAPVP